MMLHGKFRCIIWFLALTGAGFFQCMLFADAPPVTTPTTSVAASSKQAGMDWLEAGHDEIVTFSVREMVQRKLYLGTLEQRLQRTTTGYLLQWHKQVQLVEQQAQQTLLLQFDDAGQLQRLLDSQSQPALLATTLLDFSKSGDRLGQHLALGGEEQANLAFKVPQQAIAYEWLPIWLRLFPQKRTAHGFTMLEPIKSRWLEPQRSGPAKLVLMPPTQMLVAGRQLPIDVIVIEHFLGQDTLWYSQERPSQLIKWQRYSGAEYVWQSRKISN